ncbi:cation diffusion facilitator family transporter [Achromobacter pestifer]|uniref:cation diffusion facilitator family transporter n=1 Tax=Achromobacter pestifer TaxID=1353889 RepID=UPI001581713D|nr:cation transporter [Achromobacter pestifer]
MTTHTEQSVLQASILVTIVVAGSGIVFGLLSGSFSIVFDGVYMLADAGMSGLALIVARLISLSTAPGGANGKLGDRFSMGFWHLEPMVLGLNSIMLTGVAIYALINAIGSLMRGGRDLDFSYAIFYAAFALVACIGMAVYEMRINRKLRSQFVALDAKAWVMSGGITAALLLAFCVGYAIEGSSLDWITPYIDPAVLALVCLIIIPLPIGTIRQALSDVLLITPQDLKEHVDQVANDFSSRYGFSSHRSYVAKVGRGRQIELYFIVPVDMPAKPLAEWDRIRDEISKAVGDDTPDRWLTIAFTTDIGWAV